MRLCVPGGGRNMDTMVSTEAMSGGDGQWVETMDGSEAMIGEIRAWGCVLADVMNWGSGGGRRQWTNIRVSHALACNTLSILIFLIILFQSLTNVNRRRTRRTSASTEAINGESGGGRR